MRSSIKNRKVRTNNIFIKNLIAVIVLPVMFSSVHASDFPQKTWVIVIDAGHGGKDPGALGTTSREKNINLAIALKTGEYIEQNLKNVKVLYTRKSDVFIGLNERADYANKNKADLFISIHANAIPKKTINGIETWKKIKGTETYIMGPAKDEENLEVAMKENEVILLEDDFSTKYEGFDPTSPESYIMFTVMQNTFREQSTMLASNVQNQFKNRAGRVDLGVKQAGFWVLFMTTMPSILIETGYITNPEEEKYLNSKEGQDYIASAIFRASRDYINEIDKKSNISVLNEIKSPVLSDTLASVIEQEDDSLRFMIQISVSADKKELKPENFKGIKNISILTMNDRYRYVTGSFINYAEAVEYRKNLENLYPDAFVIAVKNNKVLPLQDAINSKQIK